MRKRIKGSSSPCFMCGRWFSRAMEPEQRKQVERGEIMVACDACAEHMNEEHRIDCERWDSLTQEEKDMENAEMELYHRREYGNKRLDA
jgi:hypothetical protein